MIRTAVKEISIDVEDGDIRLCGLCTYGHLHHEKCSLYPNSKMKVAEFVDDDGLITKRRMIRCNNCRFDFDKEEK